MRRMILAVAVLTALCGCKSTSCFRPTCPTPCAPACPAPAPVLTGSAPIAVAAPTACCPTPGAPVAAYGH